MLDFLSDVCGIWKHSETKTKEFNTILTRHHPVINLKYEQDYNTLLDTLLDTKAFS